MRNSVQHTLEDPFANLSFKELRSALKARADDLKSDNSWRLDDVLSYLIAVPPGEHTSESVDALTQLARLFFYAERFTEMLEAATHGARFAVAIGDRFQLARARDKQGAALLYLGRLAEATVAQAETWSIGRELSDKRLEMFAIWGMGDICAAMGQWNEAIRYYKRLQQLAEEVNAADYVIAARTNIAECAIQLRRPELGLQALSNIEMNPPPRRTDTVIHGGALAALAHLYLQVEDVEKARSFSERASLAAELGDDPTTIQKCRAAQALVNVRSGNVDEGLAAIKECLALAKSNHPSMVPNYLGMCIDAYESAGRPDDSLAYLQELVEWKRRWIEAAVTPHQHVELPEPLTLPVLDVVVDQGLIAKSYLLRAGIHARIQSLIETAINAELVRGQGIYRVFRIAELARQLSEYIRLAADRVFQIALGAQLCNIGMLAVPCTILQKSGGLSDAECQLIRDHARYGAELLRSANLHLLDSGIAIAEQFRERYDGTGYPIGLCGDDIVQEARLVSVCDAFDAMTHRRPWRSSVMSAKSAVQELRRCAGTQFDPSLVAAFTDLFQSDLSRRVDLDMFLAREAEEFEYVRALVRMEASLS